MPATVHIPSTLRHECGGACELSAQGRSVRELLASLAKSHPAVYRSVCDETGAVRRHINLFVNDAIISKSQGLDAPLADGDELYIMPAVSGG